MTSPAARAAARVPSRAPTRTGRPPGIDFRRVLEVEGGSWKEDKNGAWRQDVFAYYVSIGCNECADPACVKACPTKAHMKRAEDGLVVIDESKCIG